MPTQPLETIIYRDLAKANAKPVIDLASPLLKELVNFSSNALVRCATSSEGKENEDLAILSLYRHILEMTDATQILVAESSAYPAILMVRSSFEALISIEYITRDDDKYVTRSLAWLVGYMHNRLGMYELLRPEGQKGKEFAEALSLDKSIQADPLELPKGPKVEKAIENLESLLGDSQFASISQDYEALKGKKAWYRLDGGPDNLRELAHHVERGALYDFMYRYWSRVTHAQDFGPFISKAPGAPGTIRPIRDAEEMKTIANFSATLMPAATRGLIGKFRPDEDISTWYERDVRHNFLPLFKRQ